MNILGQFDAILADFDGTVLNSMMHLALNTVETYREHGIIIDPLDYIRYYTQPFMKMHKRFGYKCDTVEDQNEFNEKYWVVSDRNKYRSDFFPDVADVLKELHRQGLQLGIVSAAKKQAIIERFVEIGIANLFDEQHVVGQSDSKIHAIKTFCEKNSLDPGRVLFIGDAPSDLEYGKEAGVKVAGFVPKVFGEEMFEHLKSRLLEEKPDFIFSDWKELINNTIT